MRLPQFPVEGGCQCGAVRYQLKAAPLGVYACHCKDCQRFSGTTHTLSMVVRVEDAELTRGTLTGFEKAAPKQLYRRFIETAGTVTIGEDRLTVALDRRCHNPILREAALDRDPRPIPWIGRRRLVFTYR